MAIETKTDRERIYNAGIAKTPAFRECCFELLWLLIDQNGGALTVGAGLLEGVPEDALICRTDHADGSVTFERSPKR